MCESCLLYYTLPRGTRCNKVISVFFALGLLRAKGGEEFGTLLCQTCLTTRKGLDHLVSENESSYNHLDEIIRERVTDTFQKEVMSNISAVLLDLNRVNTGRIIMLLTCFYRAGVIWGERHEDLSLVRQQIMACSCMMEEAVPDYDWMRVFPYLDSINCVRNFNHLISYYFLLIPPVMFGLLLLLA